MKQILNLNKKATYKKVIAGFVTFAVIMLLVLSGPASAINLGLQEFSNTSPTRGEIVTTTATIEINSNERMSMPNPAEVLIDGSQVCAFALNSDQTCADSGVSIELLSSSDASGYGYNYDYGYGYGYNYGYSNGYGYGYGYQQGYSNSKFTYLISINTSYYNAGEHRISLQVDAGSSKVYSSGAPKLINITEGSTDRCAVDNGGCGSHGSCVNTRDSVRCVCDKYWNGATCSNDEVAGIFSGISSGMTADGIANNLDQVNAGNVEAFSGMYTEKVGKGKITFTNALNLSDSDVQTFLQNFGNKMNMSQGHISLDARTAQGLKNAGAVLEMYNLPQGLSLSQISLNVKDDDGNALSENITSAMNYTDLGVCEVGGICTIFSFNAAHFTSFDAVVDDSKQYADEETVSVDENTTEIIFDSGSANVSEVIVPGSISSDKNITLDLSALLVGDNVTLVNELTLIRETSSGVNYTAVISAGTVITGPAGWDGKILLPTVRNNSDYSVSGSVEVVVDMGSVDELNFSQPVEVILSGMAGKSAAWSRGSSTLNTINTLCNSATAPTNINSSGPRECYINSGNDLAIWTFHFTNFAAYTPTPTTIVSGGGGGNSYAPKKVVNVSSNETAGPATFTPEETTNAGNNGFFARITGAFIGALGTGGSVVVIVFLIVVVVALVIVSRRNGASKKSKKSKKNSEEDED